MRNPRGAILPMACALPGRRVPLMVQHGTIEGANMRRGNRERPGRSAKKILKLAPKAVIQELLWVPSRGHHHSSGSKSKHGGN
jgi:hypothetical protein